MAAKLDIFRILAAVDRRDKTFYDNLTDDERKAFSPYIMLRWVSTVNSNPVLESWYVEETNRMVNINYFTLARYPKFMWLMYSQVGSTQRIKHEYLGREFKKKNKKLDALLRLYPAAKQADLELLSETVSDQELEVINDEYREFESDFE